MKARYRARPLTESAIALALCATVWWVFTPMPGIGGYFNYMSASFIAIIGTMHGMRWALGVALCLNLIVGMTFGPAKLATCLFLVTPIALMLPVYRDDEKPDRPGTAPGGMKRQTWWIVFLFTYALTFTANVWVIGLLINVTVGDIVKLMASANYSALRNFWIRAGVSPGDLSALAVNWSWLIVPVIGMGYGVMVYVVNRPAYHLGLRLLKLTSSG